MAFINTLRNKMGKVVVGFVAFAILSFILADLLGPNSIFGGPDNNVGEIAGESITSVEYNQRVELFAQNYTNNFGRTPTENEMTTIRNQAWDMMINEKAFQNEYNSLGLEISDNELVDMVQGKNISSEISTSPIFANPNTGQFDRDILTTFLANIGSQAPQMQSQWYVFESNLIPARLRIKYENLLIRSNYVTRAEAQELYMEQASTADISYVFVPFSSVNDSLIKFTDADLKKYLKVHSDKYQTEASKTFKYIKFDIIPSKQDSAYSKSELEDLIEDFIAVEDDSIYARINSDGFGFYNNYSVKLMPNYLQDQLNELTVGEVYGPSQLGSSYKIYKVVEISDDTNTSARASHILFKWDEDTPEGKRVAKAEADRVLRELKNGADFVEMAREYGTDGTATRGGDLGWFETGGMVAPFQDAVFAATTTGLLNRVIETEFGYHIIDVTHTKVNSSYTIATIERTIVASDMTNNKAYRKADSFASINTNYVEFLESAERDSLLVLEASNISANQSNITGLGNAREIVRWLFTDASKNEVSSDEFVIDDSYVVAVMTGEIEEGTSSLEDVRFQIERLVKNEKKAELIASKLSGLSGTPEEIAAAYGDGALAMTMPGLKADATIINNMGTAPEAVGTVFSMQSGEISAPVEILSGVTVIKVDNITLATKIADYSAYKDQILSKRNARIGYNISESVKDAAKIKDERYKFY